MNKEHKPVIAIVDDEPRNLQLAGNLLRKRGYDIMFATSGRDALDAIPQALPDLVLLDIMMPDMDGLSVCAQMKQMEQIAEIPVIFLSARTEIHDMVRGFQAGAADYITKPFNADELLSRVATHVRLKRSREELVDANRRLHEMNQALSEANAAKDKLFSIVAHDLRGPFISLIGISRILVDDFNAMPRDEMEELMRQLHLASSQNLNLLDNLLQWARSRTENLRPQPERLHLEPCVRDVLQLFAHSASQKKIHLHSDVADDLTVHADPNMLQTILRNLVSNAIKFTPEQGRVEVTANPDHNHIRVTVADTGIGVPDQARDKLFQPGLYYTTVGTAHERGSGIGLPLCREFIEQHGGTLTLDSKPGQGARFWFMLPKGTATLRVT